MPWQHTRAKVATRYLSDALWPALFVFPKDQPPLDVDISTLDNPRVLYYYNRGYRTYFGSRSGGAAKRRRR